MPKGEPDADEGLLVTAQKPCDHGFHHPHRHWSARTLDDPQQQGSGQVKERRSTEAVESVSYTGWSGFSMSRLTQSVPGLCLLVLLAER